MQYKLSILIPSRNEEFLARTIQDILENTSDQTEIIAGLDGSWANPQIPDHPRVTLLHYSESIGQRALSNQLCKLSRAKYVAKLDAHVALDKDWDIKMFKAFEQCGDDVTMVSVMRNLHVFDWVCPLGHRRYQSPSGVCKECGQPTTKDVVWIAKKNPQSVSYRFDKTMHFQYYNEYKHTKEYKEMFEKTGLTETLSIQGSCFMLTRDKWWELDICSEEFNSWGQQGVEVACKTWLSGGRVLVNHNTWYAHMFRTQGGDFSFPYNNPQSKVDENRELSRELFQRNKWKGAIHPFSWLIQKFNPPEWTLESPTKGILYYTDNALNMKLARTCRKHIQNSGLPITSVSLKPMKFGNNIHVLGERGYATMFKQILAGLEAMTEDIVYFCEHDVLYHKNHFQFKPKNKNTFYYNGNYWFLRKKDGFAIHYDVSPLSGLVVYRETAIVHFKERLEMIEKLGEGYKPLHMGFEPFTHNRVRWKFWCPFEIFMPEFPNIDITHENNSTWKRWKQKDFIRKPKFWEESTNYTICGWENLKKML